MLAVRPTFHESWYRVANLKARLRGSAQISRQFYRGERWYVVRDPAGNQFHRLSDPAYRFVALLDGTRSVQQAWDLAGGQLADDAPTQPEVIQILSQLYSANLIETDVSPDATVLLRRHKNQLQQKMKGRLMNVLFPRIPIWDCDSFLVRWMPAMRLLLSKFGAVLWFALVIGAVAMLAPEWDRLKTAASAATDPGNWIFLWATFVLIKLIHELGHAFACRRFGGEVHEMGIMFLVFIPTPYVDASSAWSFPSRWQRMFVGAAGMIFELFVAAIMAFIWLNTSPGVPIMGIPVNELAYNAMLIASVSTVMFNANPLLRYDGYYMLSDFLEIPNLQQKSKEYALGLIKRHVFRVKQFQPLPPVPQRLWLFFYAIASSAYRVFVGLMIILLVAFKVPVLGVLMAMGGVVTWLVVPIGSITKYLALEPELQRKRLPATAFTLAVAGLLIYALGFVQFWNNVRGEGILVPEQKEVLHAQQGGQVKEVLAQDGTQVTKGQIILICTDPELETSVVQLQERLKGLNLELAKNSVTNQTDRQRVLIDIKAYQEKLDDAQRRLTELTVRSPIDGQLIAPQIDELPGKYVSRGEEIATVATMDKLVVRTVIEQRDAQLVVKDTDADAEIRLVGAPTTVLHGLRTELIAVEADRQLPSSALSHAGGGTVAPDARDPNGTTAQTAQFALRVFVNNDAGQYFPGQRAYVRWDLGKQPLALQWGRRLFQLIQTHSKSEWM